MPANISFAMARLAIFDAVHAARRERPDARLYLELDESVPEYRILDEDNRDVRILSVKLRDVDQDDSETAPYEIRLARTA